MKGTVVLFTVYFNTSSLLSNHACLLSNNACCTVTFRTCSNTSILIGDQIVYQLSLADYRVTFNFEVKHSRVCDVATATAAVSGNGDSNGSSNGGNNSGGGGSKEDNSGDRDSGWHR